MIPAVAVLLCLVAVLLVEFLLARLSVWCDWSDAEVRRDRR